MPAKPQVSYFLYHLDSPASPGNPFWRKLIPFTPNRSAQSPPKENQMHVTYEAYFKAVRTFLERDDFAMLTNALGQRLRQDITLEQVESIRIVIEKHGEFYHPARIEAFAKGSKISFVLNVALSPTGIKHNKREYGFLDLLQGKFSLSYLPRVYGQGIVEFKDSASAAMFLGDWFEGYHEFHISSRSSDQKSRILVWDSERDHYLLSAEQAFHLYTRITRILVAYYDLESFEQIYPWHHAAGDFVVKIEAGCLDVKLVTARQYAPLMKMPVAGPAGGPDAEIVLQALLIFLLNLSLRMRIDRLDGVGDFVWADEISVYGAAKGFFEGLDVKSSTRLLPDTPRRCFCQYLSLCTESDLRDLFAGLLDSFHPQAPELPVIEKHLDEHALSIYRAIRNYT
jgi:hypothetical protein